MMMTSGASGAGSPEEAVVSRWVSPVVGASVGLAAILAWAPPVDAGSRGPATSLAQRSYVAMGDSYSSGEGAPPFDPSTNTAADACHRSRFAWPRLLSADDDTVQLVAFLACSGATTADVTTRSFQTERPQIAALKVLRAAPALITITIGGNDLGFASLVADCFLTDCAHDVNGRYETRLRTMLPGLLRTTLRRLKAASPTSSTYLVGYPDIIPASWSSGIQQHCSWLSRSDWTALTTLVRNLDRVQRQAAAAAGVRFRSVTHSLAGHELCTDRPWVYPIGPTGGSLRGHPIKAGQQAIAKAVEAGIGASSDAAYPASMIG